MNATTISSPAINGDCRSALDGVTGWTSLASSWRSTSRDVHVFRCDEYLTWARGKELRHIETRRATNDRAHLHGAEEALDEFGLGLVLGVSDLD
jgi:hypothetical protein